MSLSHFVETAPLTVCGEWMADGDVQTRNTFAHLGCPDCRQWVREHRLAPGGFPDPPEWAATEFWVDVKAEAAKPMETT